MGGDPAGLRVFATLARFGALIVGATGARARAGAGATTFGIGTVTLGTVTFGTTTFAAAGFTGEAGGVDGAATDEAVAAI